MSDTLKAIFVLVSSSLLVNASLLAAESSLSTLHQKFLTSACADCHSGETVEAGFDIEKLLKESDTDATFSRWVQVFDRVHSGEMPPADSVEIDASEQKRFLKETKSWLEETERTKWNQLGRVRGRRLTNLQLERTLHDLLGIDIPLASQMPEELRPAIFTNIANAQSMSHFQLDQHLSVVDAALDEAFKRAILKQDPFHKSFSAEEVARTNPRRRTREPEMIDNFAVTWSSRLIFYGRLPATTARRDGWYRFTIRAKGLKAPEGHGVWCTVRTGKCVSSAPLLNWVGSFEATEEVQEWTFDTWLPRGEMLEVRPGDDTLKMARFAGGQVGVGEGGPQDVPGVAIESIDMQEIHLGADDAAIAKILFDDLEILKSGPKIGDIRVVSEHPKKDVARLMHRFAQNAFRRPVQQKQIESYIQLAQNEIESGKGLLLALRTGYRAILCSPRFLYFNEVPGQLDNYALASRLSYFLWNSMPDELLLSRADSGELSDPVMLRSEVRRMLQTDRGREFISDFAAEWIDLNQIDFTTPDRRLYPTFDVIVQHSMLAETEAYLQEMLDKDLSVRLIADSNHTFLNERLSRFYGIGDVAGDELQKVSLSKDDHRGGLMTQGAILKITANGTTTSPVIRGVWLSERILGVDIPPPPKGVPAIEPDIRGATSIREMLEKHKSDTTCASCHVKIDPPGFALENFDPAGRWRDNYIKISGRNRSKGATVDASFVLPSGEPFQNGDKFRQLIAAKPDQMARNIAEKLLAYGTGATVSFADREDVEEIVNQTEKSEFGFRSIVEEVVLSRPFRIK